MITLGQWQLQFYLVSVDSIYSRPRLTSSFTSTTTPRSAVRPRSRNLYGQLPPSPISMPFAHCPHYCKIQKLNWPIEKISTHSVKEVFPREPSTLQDTTESLVDQSWRVYLYVAERNFLKSVVDVSTEYDRPFGEVLTTLVIPDFEGNDVICLKFKTRHWRDCQFKNVCWLVRHYSRFSWLEIATEIQVSSYIHTRLMISLFPPACNPRFPNSKESYSLTGGF